MHIFARHNPKISERQRTDKDGLDPAELANGERQALVEVLRAVKLDLASLHPAHACLQLLQARNGLSAELVSAGVLKLVRFAGGEHYLSPRH